MKKTRGNFAVMARLVGLVRPLLGVMAGAVAMGVAGFLCAIFIPVLGGWALLDVLGLEAPLALGDIFACVLVFALARGVLHYAEQACNHFIAFKLLALIRDKVFTALRRLAPPGWRGGTRASSSPSSRRTLSCWRCSTRTPFLRYALRPLCLRQWPCLSAGITRRWACWRWPLTLWWAWRCHLPQPGAAGPRRGLPRALRRPERFRARFPARPAREHPVRRRAWRRLAGMDAQTDALSQEEEKMKAGAGGERRRYGRCYSYILCGHAVLFGLAVPARRRGL